VGSVPIFRLIQERGGVAEAELYQVFNMGIGMVVITASDKADGVCVGCGSAAKMPGRSERS